MKRGQNTPVPILRYIHKTKHNSPGLTYEQIADKVKGEFKFSIDKTTIGRILARSNPPTIQSVKTEGNRLIPENTPQQITHIRNLQILARNAIDSLPDIYPDLDGENIDDDAFNVTNVNLVKVYRRLVGDFMWKDLAEHLDDEDNVIEKMSRRLDDVLPDISKFQFALYKEDLFQAWFTVKFGGLKTISENSDTRMWEYAGLKQRCKNCPVQDYEPWL